MSHRFRSAAFGLSICLLPAACSDQTPGIEPGLATQNAGADCDAADLVLHNTTIYTANDNQWTASALAVLGDRIVYVGDESGIEPYLCSSAQIFDLTGRTVFAGFTDAHQHLEGIGRRTKTLSLFGIPTLTETVAVVMFVADKTIKEQSCL